MFAQSEETPEETPEPAGDSPAGDASSPEESSEVGSEVGPAGEPAGEPAERPEFEGDDPDAELAHADTPVPERAELLEAMQWAFSGEAVEPELLERYADFARLLLEGNQVMNLTAIIDPREVAAKHFLDSWRLTQQVSVFARHVVDLGTGAGFPGLPIAMAEEHTKISLVDSTKKRIDFLNEVIEKLGVKNAKAHWLRGEEFLATNSCDIVLMRAVSSVRENVRTLRKVRHSHKELVMFKGSSWSREVRAGEREAERLGYQLTTVYEHELPDEMGGRAILVYRAPGGQGM